MLTTAALPLDDENPDPQTAIESARETARDLSALAPVPHLEPVEDSAAVISFTPEQIIATYGPKVAAEKCTEDHVASIAWLAGLAQSERFSTGGLARLSRIDSGTLSKIFNGNYPARLDSITKRINAFRELYEMRASIGGTGFVETTLSRKIWQICETARLYSALTPIYGDPQTGKTTALIEYQRRNNHGATYYVRMPTRGNLSEFLRECAKAMGESQRGPATMLRDAVMAKLNANKVLIVDELHQTVVAAGRVGTGIRIATVEFLRELWDRTGCGLVLCGTNIFRDEADHGRHQAILEQLRRRAMTTLQLPALLPRADLDTIAATFGLQPADEESHNLRIAIIKSNGLSAYCNYLRAATYAASKRQTKPAWLHFRQAHDVLAKLSTPTK